MFGDKNSPNGLVPDGENSVTKPSRRVADLVHEDPEEKIEVSGKSIDFLRRSRDGSKMGSQELTLSYLCDNSKLGFPSYKGKEVAVSENSKQDDKWVERDFLNLKESRKREMEEEELDPESEREKKPKLETLNLSLGLPDVSLSLTASNALLNSDPPARPKPARSSQPSNNNTQTSWSNDFTAASRSYSYSHQFSHNPSCSLTDYSVGRDDQVWNCGEGTNGSVHSRFKPVGDGGVILSMMQTNRAPVKDSGNNNSLHRTASSDNVSFFPSEIPARTQSGGRGRALVGPERILREILSEPVPAVAQMVQELPEEALQSTKELLGNLISAPEKREELVRLQRQLAHRSDLTKETLSKCHKDQLGIFVAVKTGLTSFLHDKNRLPPPELVEIFFNLRCRNVLCKSLLPVDDCDCNICSSNKGFCSSCMCPVCFKFDCASNTCSWVGCDVCSHWCHAACGIQKNLIKPGPSLKGPSGTAEMQFNCIGCGHASEMFGFVKDVFMYCAKDWGLETLVKELQCVKKIFRTSEDYKGKELLIKAEGMLSNLERKAISPSDACNALTHFFNYTDTMPEFPASGVSSKEKLATQANLRKDAVPAQPGSLPSKYSMYNMNSSSTQRDSLSNDFRQDDHKAKELKAEDAFEFGKLLKRDEFDSLESLVHIKEAEARMFQNKADEARREAEGFRRMIQTKSAKLEDEYTEKLSKLCLQESEERRRKKLEEVKKLENSHCDYYNMKLRMQGEIAGLLERMEATKQQWV